MIATLFVDFSEHYQPNTWRLAASVLGLEYRYRGLEHFNLLEHALIDIGQGVKWLRRRASSKWCSGQFGWGSLMAAHQSQALGVTMGDTWAYDSDALHQLHPRINTCRSRLVVVGVTSGLIHR